MMWFFELVKELISNAQLHRSVERNQKAAAELDAVVREVLQK